MSSVRSSSASKIRICPSRYEFNDPATEREEKCRLLKEFERKMKTVVKRDTLQRTMDRTLSPKLDKRTKRCMRAVSPEFQPPSLPPTQLVAETTSLPGDAAPLASTHPTTLQVTIDARTKPRAQPPRVENWMENFLRKPTRERVRWRSKLYELEPRCSDRPPSERVEQLIDVGAQDFVDWLNTLGAERSSLTTDVVKGLFSIEAADETSRALSIAPKEIRAVPGQVATEWNVPQLALENRIAQLQHHDRMLADGGTKRIAFGRSLPQELRSGWLTQDVGDVGGEVERPDVPDDLMSLKRLFRDIWHLRSVKYLVDYLAERPSLPRPRFLEEKGLFQRQDVDEPVPFYRKVLSQKAIAESVRRQ
ncbi:uncharacterized protein LOC126560839 [Anopheles maculipalpis]|uniref:uncharacterized protein LOC126560839 n=1 Tax=Anopheles maculipalpis TaxID=1496333 RepID=UPI002158E69F|nr:uncharacterized protein LOC126560839 [Anopheles maculipalpis]